MNFGTVLKWGAIILVAWFAWQWISNNILQSQQTPLSPGMWAPPLYNPNWSGQYPWVPPVNYLNIGRGRRGRRSGPQPYGQ